MPAMRRSLIPADSLLALRQRLDRLPPKSPERSTQVASTAELYGVSTDTVYRLLRAVRKCRRARTVAASRPVRKARWNGRFAR